MYDMERMGRGEAVKPSPDPTFSGKNPVIEKDCCLEEGGGGDALASKYTAADLTSRLRPPKTLAEPSETASGGDPAHPHRHTGVPLSPLPRPGPDAYRLPRPFGPRGHPSNPRAMAHLLGSPLKTPPSGHRCPEDGRGGGGGKSGWSVQGRAFALPAPPGNCSLEPLLMRDICYPQAVGSGKTSPSNLLLNLQGGSHLLIKSRRSFFSRMDKNVNNNARLPSLQKLPWRRLPREFSLCLSFPG